MHFAWFFHHHVGGFTHTETVFVCLPIHLFKLSVTGGETLEPVRQENNRGAYKAAAF